MDITNNNHLLKTIAVFDSKKSLTLVSDRDVGVNNFCLDMNSGILFIVTNQIECDYFNSNHNFKKVEACSNGVYRNYGVPIISVYLQEKFMKLNKNDHIHSVYLTAIKINHSLEVKKTINGYVDSMKILNQETALKAHRLMKDYLDTSPEDHGLNCWNGLKEKFQKELIEQIIL